jgi:protein-S-isoprenylcysteine O-methyltransferase Ste14
MAERPSMALRLRLYRRYLPFPIVPVLLVIFPPKYWGDASVDMLLTAFGFLLSTTGESLRFWAWGSNALTGKSGVRDRGAYALMRHPLYAGNFLIVTGLAVNYANPVAFLLLVTPFAFVYNVITRAEEKLMAEKFASAYQGYRASCLPRFLPAMRNWGLALRTTFPFNWGFAWRKEYPSCCACLAGFAGLELYQEVLAYGWTRSWYCNWLWVAVMVISGSVALLLSLGKKP